MAAKATIVICLRTYEHGGGPMMEFDSGPVDAMPDAALVARVAGDIDQSDKDERDALLSDLLSAAWPMPTAQPQ